MKCTHIEVYISFIQFLTLIMERYLLPLKEESVLPQEEVSTQLSLLASAHFKLTTVFSLQVDNLTANIPQIISFQKQFLKTLEVCSLLYIML